MEAFADVLWLVVFVVNAVLALVNAVDERWDRATFHAVLMVLANQGLGA